MPITVRPQDCPVTRAALDPIQFPKSLFNGAGLPQFPSALRTPSVDFIQDSDHCQRFLVPTCIHTYLGEPE